MLRKICFATGNLWSWNPDRKRLLDYCMKLPIDGVELTWGYFDKGYIDMTQKQISYLRSLDRVSVHAPFYLGEVKDKKELNRILTDLEEIYHKIKAEVIIWHPYDLPPPNILKRYRMEHLFENMTPFRKLTVRKLQNVYRKYPLKGMCLDVAHAYLWSPTRCTELVKAFKPLIKQIHVSAAFRGLDHQSMQTASKSFMRSIRPIFDLDCPIVIEEDIRNKSIPYVRAEIKHIRGLFRNPIK